MTASVSAGFPIAALVYPFVQKPHGAAQGAAGWRIMPEVLIGIDEMGRPCTNSLDRFGLRLGAHGEPAHATS